jgi:hypothetical protein
MNRVKHIAVAVLSCLTLLAASAYAQAPAAPSLQELLKAQYKVTKAANDDQGFKILDAGTVVVAKQAGIMATAQPKPHMIGFKLFKICDNTFKNGNLTVPKGCATTTFGSHFLTAGEKLYVTKFEVNEKSNKITFNLVECDSCNGVQAQSSMKATIEFEFANKFLDTAEPGQVTDVIDQVFQPEKRAR